MENDVHPTSGTGGSPTRPGPILQYRSPQPARRGSAADTVAAIMGVMIAVTMFLVAGGFLVASCAAAAHSRFLVLVPVVFGGFALCLASGIGAVGTAVNIMQGHRREADSARHAQRLKEKQTSVFLALVGLALLFLLLFLAPQLAEYSASSSESVGSVLIILTDVAAAAICLRMSWRKMRGKR